MAQKRMFSKSVTNSSQFLMMPSSSQTLYFHLGMNADDDGFCEHFSIMRMTDSKPDDLKILISKGYVYIFDEMVLIILNWKENNYLRADRYTASKYLEIYKNELKLISDGIPKVNQMDNQISIDKIRIDKTSIDNKTNMDVFEKIWKLYNYKVKKQKAITSFKKIKESDYNSILEHIPRYVNSTPKKEFRMHLVTYLNNKSWNDDIINRGERQNAAINDINEMSDEEASLYLKINKKQLEG